MAPPEPVGNRTVGAHRLPPVQEEILPQDINQQFVLYILFDLWFISTQPMFTVRLHIMYGAVGKICRLFYVNNQL